MVIKEDYPCDGCGYKSKVVMFRSVGICARCLVDATLTLARSWRATVVLQDDKEGGDG
jgi:hypothetical protein